MGDTSFNNSLLILLDSQHKIQQDTTQALKKIINLQDTRATDMFLSDLPIYTGDPKLFLDWILRIEKIAQITGLSE